MTANRMSGSPSDIFKSMVYEKQIDSKESVT